MTPPNNNFRVAFPSRATQRIAVKVKPAAERSIRQGHPWIFDGSILKQNREGEAGDLAIVYDQSKNKFLALGLYDPYSPMRIKLLQFRTPSVIDQAWFKERIELAYEKRKPLFETDTNSYRLLFGENDGLPGFIADIYANVLVIKLYSLAWFPHLEQVLGALLETIPVTAVILRLSRNVQRQKELLGDLHDGQLIYGELAQEEVQFKEHGLLFTAQVIKGHKTGYFLDHRHNRHRVGQLSKGKTVLDVFAYAGGFSVHALAGGAREVTSLDISHQALAMAEKNVLLNSIEAEHNILIGDAFQQLSELANSGKKFDLIVVDPPSFAKQESEREKAQESYRRLTLAAARLTQKGGVLVMASCSSRIRAEEFYELITTTLSENDYRFQEQGRTQHDIDHPIGFEEGAYLKCIYFAME